MSKFGRGTRSTPPNDRASRSARPRRAALALPLIATLLALEPGWLQAQGTEEKLPAVTVGVIYDGPSAEGAARFPLGEASP